MSKVAIVTDSTADFPKGAVEELDITVVPVQVIIGEKSYKDGTELTREEFAKKLQNNPNRKLYNTSQPPPSDFAEAYKRLRKEIDSIISLHPPAELSGIYNSARLGAELAREKAKPKKEDAKKEEDKPEILVIDSSSVSFGLGILVMKAAEMAKAGASSGEIVETIEKLKSKIYVYALLDNLPWVRQGRGASIDGLGLLIGSFIGLKVAISLHNGKLARASGTIGYRKKEGGIEGLIRIFQGLKTRKIQRAGVIYTPGANEAEEVANWLKLECPDLEIPIIPTGPALTVQAGPNVIAFGVLTE